jgi:hypothetical protein
MKMDCDSGAQPTTQIMFIKIIMKHWCIIFENCAFTLLCQWQSFSGSMNGALRTRIGTKYTPLCHTTAWIYWKNWCSIKIVIIYTKYLYCKIIVVLNENNFTLSEFYRKIYGISYRGYRLKVLQLYSESDITEMYSLRSLKKLVTICDVQCIHENNLCKI